MIVNIIRPLRLDYQPLSKQLLVIAVVKQTATIVNTVLVFLKCVELSSHTC